MPNKTVTVVAMDSKSENRGVGGKSSGFEPSVPAGYVRPKAVPVPSKSK